MKTLLFTLALSFNILLVAYPFQEHISSASGSETAATALKSQAEEVVDSKPLGYAELLRKKAATRLKSQ